MKYFTQQELKDALSSLEFHGEILFELHTNEHGEKALHILDEVQERFIDGYGDVVEGEYRETHKVATFYTDSNDVITLIEHPYTAITKNNVKHVKRLLSLIGNTLIFS